MSKTDAVYMRAYRARRKAASEADQPVDPSQWSMQRIAELETEVKHLKAELAKRTNPDLEGIRSFYDVSMQRAAGSFNSRPFTPAPKGK